MTADRLTQLRQLEATLDNVLSGVSLMIIQDEDCNPDIEARLESIGSSIQNTIVSVQALRKELADGTQN